MGEVDLEKLKWAVRRLGKQETRRPRKLPWKLIALMLAAAFVAILALRLWEGKQEETVQFLSFASFTYLGSEDNTPIENIAIRFPSPNIENKPAKVRVGTWALYYQDNENMLHLQLSGAGTLTGRFFGFRGERREDLRVLLAISELTDYGPKITYVLDKLYPSEVFCLASPVEVLKRDVDKLTLREYGDNEGRSSGAFFKYSPLGPFEKPINVSFFAQLARRVDNGYEIVETFSRKVENLREASPRLYPTQTRDGFHRIVPYP